MYVYRDNSVPPRIILKKRYEVPVWDQLGYTAPR